MADVAGVLHNVLADPKRRYVDANLLFLSAGDSGELPQVSQE